MSAACKPRSVLESKADRVYAAAIDRLRGEELPLHPRDLVILAREPGGVLLLDSLIARPALAALGLADLHDAIDAARERRDPLDIPVVIIVDGQACCAWTDAAPLASGGAC